MRRRVSNSLRASSSESDATSARRRQGELAIQSAEDEITLAALTAGGRLQVAGITINKNMMTGEAELERSGSMLDGVEGEVQDMTIEVKQRELYVVHAGRFVSHFDISDKANPRMIMNVQTCRGSHTNSLVQDPNDNDNVYDNANRHFGRN